MKDWKKDFMNFTSDKKYLDLLENGAKSLTDSWLLQALFSKWKKIRGIENNDPKENKGQLQSSFKEWENNIK